jgi:hypothetical protein
MPPEQYKWDFFIAHAGPDCQAAEELHHCLQSRSRVFLDSRNLKLGDDWDIELPKAQRNSLVTVVLISSKTEAAYYQREEIAAALGLARRDAERHRVVPVFLDRDAQNNESVPYGLTIKHGVTVSAQLSLKEVGQQLLDLISDLAKNAGDSRELLSKTTAEKEKATSFKPVKRSLPEPFVDFEDPQNLFKGMLAESSLKHLMFIQAPGGRGKTSLLRVLCFHCEQESVPCCSIDFSGQPYDNPHFTLALLICDHLGIIPTRLAAALQSLNPNRPQGDIDDPDVVSQILAGVNESHEGLRQRYVKERLKNAFLADLSDFVQQRGRVIFLFDGFERLSTEEEDWLFETLLRPVATGKLQNVIVVTAGDRWPKINRWEWEQNTHLLDGLPTLKAEHIKIYAERVNIKITDDEAIHYWKASGGGIPLYMVMVVYNLRTLIEVSN